MKIKALENWPPQAWQADAQTLAPEEALDGIDVSASVDLENSGALTLSVLHNERRYCASLALPPALAGKVALLISGAGPDKPLREIGELEIGSEVSE